MRLFSYVILSDSGFAPNPFHGCCTLATCKRRYRLEGNVGDWIIGISSPETVGRGKIVYAMRVEEKLTYDQYYRDARFQAKKVSDPEIPPDCAGDNMYYIEGGIWRRHPDSFRHATVEQVMHDLEGKYVLASWSEYFYFGREAVLLPEWAVEHLSLSPGEERIHGPALTVRVRDWLHQNFPRGTHGTPWCFIRKSEYGKEPELLPANLKIV